jgi:hypothetical protein
VAVTELDDEELIFKFRVIILSQSVEETRGAALTHGEKEAWSSQPRV